MKSKRKGNLDKVARDKKTGQFKKLRRNAKSAAEPKGGKLLVDVFADDPVRKPKDTGKAELKQRKAKKIVDAAVRKKSELSARKSKVAVEPVNRATVKPKRKGKDTK